MSLPVAYDYASGAATYVDQRVPLSPTGRELGIELAYSRKLDLGGAFQAKLMQRFQPGHVEDAAPETTALLRFKIAF